MSTVYFSPRIPKMFAGAKAIPIVSGTKRPPRGWNFDDYCILQGGEVMEPGQRVGILMDGKFVVFDADIRAEGNGLETIKRLFGDETLKSLAQTFTVRTPSGGYHFYYRQNPAAPVRSKTFKYLDIKASPKSFCVFGDGYVPTKLSLYERMS